METKQVTQEELKEIVELRDSFAAIFQNIGIIQSRIRDLELENQKNYELLSDMRKNEDRIFNNLKDKYGEGTLDLTTGQINYNS
jgi:predicted nuclease with TOPRIM domain